MKKFVTILLSVILGYLFVKKVGDLGAINILAFFLIYIIVGLSVNFLSRKFQKGKD